MNDPDIWCCTFSGTPFDLLRPQPEQVKLIDIAHALSRIARFNGHTVGEFSYSVAQHSVLVESLLPDGASVNLRLHALLHDAHEAYVGDIATPVRELMLYHASKATWFLINSISPLDAAIWQAFALKSPTDLEAKHIKQADLQALWIEKETLLTLCDKPWGVEWPELPKGDLKLDVLPPNQAKAQFIGRAKTLLDQRHGV